MDGTLRCAEAVLTGSSDAATLAGQVFSVCKTQISEFLRNVSSDLHVGQAQPLSCVVISAGQTPGLLTTVVTGLLVVVAADESTKSEAVSLLTSMLDVNTGSSVLNSAERPLHALQGHNFHVRARPPPELDAILARLVMSAFPGLALAPANAIPALKEVGGLSHDVLASCAQKLSSARIPPSVPLFCSALHLSIALHDIAMARSMSVEGLSAATPLLNFVWTQVPKLLQSYMSGEHGDMLRQALASPCVRQRTHIETGTQTGGDLTLGQMIALKACSALRDSCISLLPFDFDTLYLTSDLQQALEASLTSGSTPPTLPTAGAVALSAIHAGEAALTGDLPCCADLCPFADMDLSVPLCSPVLGDSALSESAAKRTKMPAFWNRRLGQVLDGLPDALAHADVTAAFCAAIQASSALAVCPLAMPALSAVLRVSHAKQAATDTLEEQAPRMQGVLDVTVARRKPWSELQGTSHGWVQTLLQTVSKTPYAQAALAALVASAIDQQGSMTPEKNQCSLRALARLATSSALLQLEDTSLPSSSLQVAQAVLFQHLPSVLGLLHAELWWQQRIESYVQQLVTEVTHAWSQQADIMATVSTPSDALQPVQSCIHAAAHAFVSVCERSEHGQVGQLAAVLAEGMLHKPMHIRQFSQSTIQSTLASLPASSAAGLCASLAPPLLQALMGMRVSGSSASATSNDIAHVDRAAAALVYILAAPCCPTIVAQVVWSALLPSLDPAPSVSTAGVDTQKNPALVVPAHAQLFSSTLHSAPIRAIFRACAAIDKGVFLRLAQRVPQAGLLAWLSSSIDAAVMLGSSIIEVVSGSAVGAGKAAPPASSVDTSHLAVYGPLLAELLCFLGDALCVAVPIAQHSPNGSISPAMWRINEASKSRGPVLQVVGTVIDWLKPSLDWSRHGTLAMHDPQTAWPARDGAENIPPPSTNVFGPKAPASSPGPPKSSQEGAPSASDALMHSLLSVGALVPVVHGVTAVVKALASEPTTLTIGDGNFAVSAMATVCHTCPGLLSPVHAAGQPASSLAQGTAASQQAIARAVQCTLDCSVALLWAMPATIARKPESRIILENRAHLCIQTGCSMLLCLAAQQTQAGNTLQRGSLLYITRSCAELLTALTAALPSLRGRAAEPLSLDFPPGLSGNSLMDPTELVAHVQVWAQAAQASYAQFFSPFHSQLAALHDAERGESYLTLLNTEVARNVRVALSPLAEVQRSQGLKVEVMYAAIEAVLSSIGL